MKMIEKTMDITFIRDFINKIISSDMDIDKSHLYGDGAIYYCNGNDGTDFDYTSNGRTCEFYVYYNNGVGAIKCFVAQSNIEAYIFPEDNPYGNDYKHVTLSLDNDFSLYELAQALFEDYDLKGKFDKKVTDWAIKYRGIWD